MRVKCQKCGYKWDYTGDLMRASCPNCGAKVPVGGGTDED